MGAVTGSGGSVSLPPCGGGAHPPPQPSPTRREGEEKSRTVRSLLLPLLLSLAVHGLLFLALWLWPTHTRPPVLSIENTRLAMETCRFDIESPVRSGKGAQPPRLQGPKGRLDFSPQLKEADPQPAEVAFSPRLFPSLSGSPIPAARGTHASNGSPEGGHGAGMFPLPGGASSVVFALDRSVSMGVNNKLDLACRELLASLRQLPPSARFQVIAYNTSAQPLAIGGRIDLLPVEPAILDEVASTLHKLVAAGGTDHVQALCRGLALHPDVLFFVTDADDLPPAKIDFIRRCNHGTVIHTIELSRRRNARQDGPLAQLRARQRRHVSAGLGGRLIDSFSVRESTRALLRSRLFSSPRSRPDDRSDTGIAEAADPRRAGTPRAPRGRSRRSSPGNRW